jgi:hypothetical protein
MAAAAAISLALQVLGAGNSIAGGIRAKKEARDAERAAKSAMEEAKKNISLNQYQAMQVPTEAFDLASRGITAGQMQATSALQEAGGRALLGGLGRVQAAGIQGQEAQRQMMQKALMDRDRLIADEQAAINQRLAAMSINQALGAQERVREREMAGNQMIASGVKGLGSAAVSAFKESDLFKEQEGLDVDPIDTEQLAVLDQTAQDASGLLQDDINAQSVQLATPQMDALSVINQLYPFLIPGAGS